MIHISKSIFLTFAFVLFTSAVLAQVIEEKTYKEEIKSVQVYKNDDQLALPVIRLDREEKVTLRFDELSGNSKNYSYKIIHCNAQWEPTNLSENEYLTGQNPNVINEVQSSFNTIIPYYHYKLTIPNFDVQPRISGNYTIVIFENSDPQDTVLTSRFRVSEDMAHVSAEVDHFNRMSPEKPNQKLEIEVNTNSLNVNRPSEDLQIAVQKNYHDERLIRNEDPSGMRGNTLIYQNIDDLAFKGGNEYRHFNTKSTDYAGENIQQIEFMKDNFHVSLDHDRDLTYKDFKTKDDINGRFFVDKERVDNPFTEADYVYVYFTLLVDTPNLEGGVYIEGGFNNWKKNSSNKMNYNGEEKAYEKRLLLKQGYYDYKYVQEDIDGYNPYVFSGNHYQTENEYSIYIYYKDFSSGYDRLIGHTVYTTPGL
ncbi:MAG: type IX secretion system plug protein domain-containing protein [Bacteroidales bacterium]